MRSPEVSAQRALPGPDGADRESGVIQRACRGDSDAGVYGPNLPVHAVDERQRRSGGAHQNAAAEDAGDGVGQHRLGQHGVPDAIVPGVGNHADNLEKRVGHGRFGVALEHFEPDLAAERIFVSEVLSRQGLVN